MMKSKRGPPKIKKKEQVKKKKELMPIWCSEANPQE